MFSLSAIAINGQSAMSGLWGSVAFLISSLLQWYEAVNGDPKKEALEEPGELNSWQVHPL